MTNLKRIGLLTVEAVAAANEQAINAYGMGGRELKSLAAKFLTTADKDKSAVAMQALEAENTSLKERLASLEKQLATLAARVDVPTAPAPAAPIPYVVRCRQLVPLHALPFVHIAAFSDQHRLILL